MQTLTGCTKKEDRWQIHTHWWQLTTRAQDNSTGSPWLIMPALTGSLVIKHNYPCHSVFKHTDYHISMNTHTHTHTGSLHWTPFDFLAAMVIYTVNPPPILQKFQYVPLQLAFTVFSTFCSGSEVWKRAQYLCKCHQHQLRSSIISSRRGELCRV